MSLKYYEKVSDYIYVFDLANSHIKVLHKMEDYTITADNGSELVGHEEIARKLNSSVYFTAPYASHLQGLNENFNGLLQQYIPKGTDWRTISHSHIEKIQKSVNMRLRCVRMVVS